MLGYSLVVTLRYSNRNELCKVKDTLNVLLRSFPTFWNSSINMSIELGRMFWRGWLLVTLGLLYIHVFIVYVSYYCDTSGLSFFVLTSREHILYLFVVLSLEHVLCIIMFSQYILKKYNNNISGAITTKIKARQTTPLSIIYGICHLLFCISIGFT